MKKSEILALIENCAKKLNERIALHPEQEDTLKGYFKAFTTDFNAVSNLPEDSESLEKFASAYKNVYFKITNEEYKTNDDIIDEIISEIKASSEKDIEEENEVSEEIEPSNKKKVKEIKTKDEQTEEEKEVVKKSKGKLKKLGIALLIVALLGAGHHIGKAINQKDNENNLETDNTVNEEVIETVTAINIDVNNYDELLTYAMDLQNELPENNRPTIDDIMYAIKLANFDLLTDKNVFKERDEVCYSSLVSGYLIQNTSADRIIQRDEESDINISETDLQSSLICVTDNKLNISCFEAAKNEKGYDIYRVCDICSKNLNNETNAFEYAKVFNDIVARFLKDFAICEKSPISTIYTITGLYNVCLPRILELTAGQNLGPIYGSTYRIDGNYGHVCIEELANILYISTEKGEAVGNPENELFTTIIDATILQKELTK